jgi:hypothetical protein
MAKRRFKVHFRLPEYRAPRTEWRRSIYEAAFRAFHAAAVELRPQDRISLELRLYLRSPALDMHDVDNRLKDVMDALQGHVGGNGKKGRALSALLPNDTQVIRVYVDKGAPPGQSHGLGHVTIRRYEPTRRSR